MLCLLRGEHPEQRLRGGCRRFTEEPPGFYLARHSHESAIEHRTNAHQLGGVLRTQHSLRFAECPDAARCPVRHALPAAWCLQIRAPRGVDEVDELAISLFHRGDESKQSD